MKKILLITCNWGIGYENKIIEELQKQGYHVVTFNPNSEKYRKARKIKNPFLKIYNDQYLKKYKNYNLKDQFQAEALNKDLAKEEFEIFLKIGIISLHEITLKFLKEKCSKMISHHWDTIEFVKIDVKLEKKYFDKISSFYRKDCEKFDLEYLPNFYSETFEKLEKIKNDIYTVMADKTKKEILENVAKLMKKQNIKTNLNLVIKNSKECSDLHPVKYST